MACTSLRQTPALKYYSIQRRPFLDVDVDRYSSTPQFARYNCAAAVLLHRKHLQQRFPPATACSLHAEEWSPFFLFLVFHEGSQNTKPKKPPASVTPGHPIWEQAPKLILTRPGCLEITAAFAPHAKSKSKTSNRYIMVCMNLEDALWREKNVQRKMRDKPMAL